MNVAIQKREMNNVKITIIALVISVRCNKIVRNL